MFWLYAKPDIRSVAALKGKKVGVSSLGSGPDSLLREVLKKHGLDSNRDVAVMPVGSGTGRFFALQAGSVDAAMLSVPANLLAQEAGFRELVSFINEEWIELQGTVNATEQLLAADPGAGGEVSPRNPQRVHLLSRTAGANDRLAGAFSTHQRRKRRRHLSADATEFDPGRDRY